MADPSSSADPRRRQSRSYQQHTTGDSRPEYREQGDVNAPPPCVQVRTTSADLSAPQPTPADDVAEPSVNGVDEADLAGGPQIDATKDADRAGADLLASEGADLARPHLDAAEAAAAAGQPQDAAEDADLAGTARTRPRSKSASNKIATIPDSAQRPEPHPLAHKGRTTCRSTSLGIRFKPMEH